MENKDLLLKAKAVIAKLKRSMLVHPDCTEGSEFDDMTSEAQEMEDEIELALMPPIRKSPGIVKSTMGHISTRTK